MIDVMLQPSEIAPDRVRPLRRAEYDLTGRPSRN